MLIFFYPKRIRIGQAPPTQPLSIFNIFLNKKKIQKAQKNTKKIQKKKIRAGA